MLNKQEISNVVLLKNTNHKRLTKKIKCHLNLQKIINLSY